MYIFVKYFCWNNLSKQKKKKKERKKIRGNSQICPPLPTSKEMVTSPHTLKTAPTTKAVSTADETILKLSSLTKNLSITCL